MNQLINREQIPFKCAQSLRIVNYPINAQRFMVRRNAEILVGILESNWGSLKFEVLEVVPEKSATYYVVAVWSEVGNIVGYYSNK